MKGLTTLMAAASRGHVDVVQVLLANQARIEEKSHHGWSAVHFAAQNGHVNVVDLLVENGVSVDSLGNDYSTPLTVAIDAGQYGVCAYLRGRGASQLYLTAEGETALHLAVKRGRTEIVKLLIGNRGADLDAVDVNGQTPSGVALVEGHFELLQYLQKVCAKPLDLTTFRHQTWSLDAVWELYDRKSHDKPSRPLWYIDPSQVTTIESISYMSTPAMHAAIGSWSGTRVLVLQLNLALCNSTSVSPTELRRAFQHVVSAWFPLRHPHVVRLFGACHRGQQPFMVPNGTLRTYVRDRPSCVWTKLHKIALGLQHLHERGLVHGDVKGENLLVAEDGSAKLAGFGMIQTNRQGQLDPVDHKTPVWEPGEVFRGLQKTMESDIYALAMCIFEVVSDEVPYANEAANLESLVNNAVLPTRPPSMSDRGWALVTRMLAFEPIERPNITDVVRELSILATEEKLAPSTMSPNSSLPHDGVEVRARVKKLIFSAQSHLDKHTREVAQAQLCTRIAHAVAQAESIDSDPAVQVLSSLGNVLARFLSELEARASMIGEAKFAADRRHAERIYAFHTQLDRIVEQFNGQPLSADALYQKWRDTWHKDRQKQLKMLGVSLADAQNLDVASTTCLLFELTMRRDAYSLIYPSVIQSACSKLRSISGVRVPSWFIPQYEVAFDAFNSFSRGGFGSVHHGEWMGSRVVIKKVFSTEVAQDDTEFTHEVELWSQLYHPNVLQLFGACHVGEKFIVSELAVQGQLDEYLRQPGKRHREVWRKLYEAALGLQYLHDRGIVHCDLKCNNILIGRDGKAKVSDYGLSRKQQLSDQDHTSNPAITTGVGAPRWKAPEVLIGDEATFAADVYSVGMCVVEAVTGDYPWGPNDRDELVADHVKCGGKIFDKPRAFSDAQWELVIGACRFEPTDRLELSEMIALLETFAEESKEQEEEVEEREWTAEPEPEQRQLSDDAVFSKGAIGAAVDALLQAPTVVRKTSPPNRSFEESWGQ